MIQVGDVLQEAEPRAHPDQNIEDSTLEQLNSSESQGGMVLFLCLDFKKLFHI